MRFLFFFTFEVTIDRIESNFAVIEWENLALSTIPMQIIKCEVKEGSKLDLLLHFSPTGALASPPLIYTEYGEVLIPVENTIKHATRYNIWIQCREPLVP